MALASTILFVLGVIIVALAFAAALAHAVLLANGRRALALVQSPQPAFATVPSAGASQRSEPRRRRGSQPRGRAHAPGPPGHDPRAAGIRCARGLARASVACSWDAARGAACSSSRQRSGRASWAATCSSPVAIRSAQIGFLPLGVALGLLLYASSLPIDIQALQPALQNPPLLTIHVGMAVISYGIFATAFAAGVGYLLQGTTDRHAWLPSHKTLDEVAYRAVIIGFPIFATMIVLGSWWASIAWSRYWGWDPKETAALVTWLVYAVYLHARNQRRWAGRPAALLLVLGFAMVLVTWSGSLWFSGLHAYSGLD